ncbi:chaoptin-like [Ischnura elegans]|uniref:chaoptin-like n=1 Tax=Ischnura elegans TaxID=197161 RepID=UPI001ED89EC6|nr:chaoptin-like [Ischnura elegans]
MSLKYIKYVILCDIIFLTFSSSTSNNRLQKLFDNPECDCYLKIFRYSCHCRESLSIQLVDGVNTSLTLTCNNGTASDPYKYFSQLRLDDLPSFLLFVNGCPPANAEFSSIFPLSTKYDGYHVGNTLNTLILNCRGLKTFILKSHYLRNLENLQTLYISCPSISTIPGDFLRDSSKYIHNLTIKETALEYIPRIFFSHLPSLVSLNLMDNKLKTIPSLHNFMYLKSIDISGNNIGHLENEIFLHTNNLDSVILSRNRLSVLPKTLYELKKLRRLEAEENRMKYVILQCLADTESIFEINFSGNNLQTLEPKMSSTTTFNSTEACANTSNVTDAKYMANTFSTPQDNVMATTASHFKNNFSVSNKINSFQLHLDLSKNELTRIPEDAFSHMEHLWKLNISFNRISNLPSHLFQSNKRLKTLDLSNNLISNISETFLRDNTELQCFNISSNNIETLGKNFFDGLLNLREIDLSNNTIEYLPETIFLPLKKGKHSLSLNMKENRLTSLPMLPLPQLVDLNLARNRLTIISPDALTHLRALERINLSYNSIQTTDVSASSGSEMAGENLFHENLRRLKYVDFSNNRLTKYPNTTNVYTTLLSLNFSGNLLDEILLRRQGRRGLVIKYPNLQSFDLSNNSLRQVFQQRENYSLSIEARKIMYLDLSRNGISFDGCLEYQTLTEMYCDSFFKRLNALEVLILAHNEIEVIPEHFAKLDTLRRVDFRHNKIRIVSFYNLFYVNAFSASYLNLKSGKNYVPKGDNYELPNTRHLEIDLRHNKIAHVDLPDFKIQKVLQGCDVDKMFAHATILLGYNPITCGCQIYGLLQYSLKEIRPVTEEERWSGSKNTLPVTVDIRDLSCWEPLSVRGRNVSDPETWIHHLLPLFGLCSQAGALKNPSNATGQIASADVSFSRDAAQLRRRWSLLRVWLGNI